MNANDFVLFDSSSKETVVRPDELVILCLDNYWEPLRPDTRIYNRHMNRTARKSRGRLGQNEAGNTDIVFRDLMRDVYDSKARIDGQDDPAHAGNVLIFDAEVAQHRDNSRSHINCAAVCAGFLFPTRKYAG